MVRAALPSRKTFFDDLRALTRYLLLAGRGNLPDSMMRELSGYDEAPMARRCDGARLLKQERINLGP